MKTAFFLILLLCMLIPFGNISAQDYRKSSFDINAGLTLPHMDVAGGKSFVGSFGYNYTFAHPVAAHVNIMLGTLTGSDQQSTWDRKFTNNIFGVMAGLDLNLFAAASMQNLSQYVDPYVFAETGPLFSNIVSINENDQYGTVPYNGTDLAYGFGGGLKIYLSPVIDLNCRYSFIGTGSDLIDGHNASVVANKANDYFSTILVGVNIKLGPSGEPHAMWATRWDIEKESKLTELKKRDKEKAKKVLHGNKGKFEKNNSRSSKKEEVEEPPVNEKSNEPSPEKEEQSAFDQSNKSEHAAKTGQEDDHHTPDPEKIKMQQESEVAVNADTTNKEPKPDAEENDWNDSSKQPNAPAPEADEGQSAIYKSGVVNVNGEIGKYRYYVIAGSFSNFQNASEFVSKRSNSGQFEIITDSANRHYRVVGGRTNKLSEAKTIRARLKRELDPETWILENANF